MQARDREPSGPFRNPNETPPGEREGEQLPIDELDKTLIEAQRYTDQGDTVRAMHLLYRCANKIPASARCEGELGMLMLEAKTRKPHADYFVREAAKLDDPDANVSFYRRLAETTNKWAQFDASTAAWERVLQRVGDEATADDYAGYAAALQGERTRKQEAIAALAKAYELAPDRHEYLRDQATLVAQTDDASKAIELFERYKGTGHASPKETAAIDARIATLRHPAPVKKKRDDEKTAKR